MRLVFGKDAAVAKWVAARIPFVAERGFGPCKAIGIVGSGGRELAGVVWHDWQPEFKTIAFSLAADSPRWATRRLVCALLMYPFEDCGAFKLWTATPHRNERALKMAKGLGFIREAVLAHHFGKNNHAVINRMFVDDYRRLYGSRNMAVRPPMSQIKNNVMAHA